jgi:AraC family transcriptional regulator
MKPVTEADYRERIARVVAALAADPVTPRSLAELARLAHFSRFHFHRIFRAMTGESVIETARRVRLTRAAHRLATTDAPVTYIAMDAGYESVQTFSRAFRAFTTVAPSAFRDRRIRLAELVKGRAKPSGNHCGRGGNEMQVEIIERRPVSAHVIRHAGPMTKAGETFARLWQWQVRHGVAGRATEAIGIFYGDPEGGDEFRYFAGVIYPTHVAPEGEVESHQVPGGRYASYRLLGPYDLIHPAFERLYGEWLPASGYVPDDRPALEIYRNNPYSTPANELITDLLIPVR